MLDKTISKAMEPSSDDRFQSAEEMRQALEAALREPEEKRRRRRRIGIGVVGALVLCAGIFGGVAAAKPDVRGRAWAAAKPMIDRLKGAPTEVAAAAPAEEAEVAEEPAPTGEEPAAVPVEEASDEASEPTAEEAKAEPAPAEAAEEETAKPEAEVAKAEPEPEKKEEKSAASDDEMFSAQPVQGESGDKVEGLLAAAQELVQSGKKIKALNEYRKIGKKHRKDPRALKAWSEAAAQMKGYGEALRVAKRWADVDKSIEARIFLASMQRKVGKREDAIKTLNALLQERPGCQEARSMLKGLSPEARVAQK